MVDFEQVNVSRGGEVVGTKRIERYKRAERVKYLKNKKQVFNLPVKH